MQKLVDLVIKQVPPEWLGIHSGGTCSASGVMYVSSQSEEVLDGNREQGPKGWHQARCGVQEEHLLLPDGGGRGWQRAQRLQGGNEFKSPSSAGTASTSKACNGWTFWSVEESYPWAEMAEDEQAAGQGEAALEQPPQPEQEEPQADAQLAVGSRRVPNQRSVPEGQVRLYCNACKKGFTAAADQLAEACPAGHRSGHRSGDAQQVAAES